MTFESLVEFGKVFGLPGLFVLVWYLLERDKNKRNEVVEKEKCAVEAKKADAMTAGFTSLSGQINAHQVADLESHREMGEGLAKLHGKIDQALADRTPVRGVPIGEYGPVRPKQGGR